MGIYGFLKSQKTGIITGFAVTGFLIIGSLIMNYFPESYEGLTGEDITFFYKNIKPINIWFYIMFIGFVMYGICIFVCTLDSIIKKIRVRSRKIPLYGAAIVHIGFIITLVAHLIGGIWAGSGQPVTVADSWVESEGFEMKVTDFESTSYPNGMPKKIKAYMKIRKDGREFDETLGYNNPILLELGVREILLRTYGNVPNSVILNVGGEVMDLKINDGVEINGANVFVANLYLPPQFRMPVLLLALQNKDSDEYDQIILPIGNQNTKEVNGKDVTFEDIKTSPAVVVSVKENPSIPLTLIAIGFFGSGMLLVIFRTAYKMVRVL